MGVLIGVITRRDFANEDVDTESVVGKLIKRPPIYIFEDQSLRDAADLMTIEGVGRVIVVSKQGGLSPIGIITRSDLVEAHRLRLHDIRAKSSERKILRK